MTQGINLDEAARLLGYERIKWDADNQCYSGYGSSDPCDRSRDGEEGAFVADDDDDLRKRIVRAR